MTVIYLTVKLLTFPGTFLKAFWEHCILRIMRIHVEDRKYMSMNEMCGHIEHRLIKSKAKSFLFCLLPGVINGILALPMLFAGAVNLFYLGAGMRDITTALLSPLFFVYIVIYYLGAALWCNKYPLFEDVLHLWDEIFRRDTPVIAKILLFIPTSVMYAGAFLERYGLNFLLLAAATALIIFI